MPEIRKDPVFGRWVIIASERGLRPNEFLTASEDSVYKCPFCPGNESLTPPAIYSLPSTDGGWRLRVVPNKYPALVSGGVGEEQPDGIYNRMDGVGSHEVLIENARHGLRLEEMELEAIADVVRAFILRTREIKKDPGVKYIMIFKNHGRNAGASLAHPHSQIIVMPMVPIRLVEEIGGAERYFEKKGTCVFCDIVKEEPRFKKRVVAENGHFLAIEPYASRFSFETWLLPKKHLSHFEDMPEELVLDLASILKNTLGRLYATIPEFSYNLVVHTMPVQEPRAAHYHWHIEIMPKLSQVAGFEWGTGFYINTVSPEDAAAMLNGGKKYKI
ncbi:MAG TPA: galactose-1-phosphate uridylyltransferase [Elusimicrobia bacterium]|nr:galactose-1-phosphate uridylyltransferase [Elusimicrobiota bacterium]